MILKDALSGLRQYLANERTAKMMKNAFCFTWKALFVLKIFEFLSWLFGRREISKFMTSKPGKQTIAIHILLYISRSKNNQAAKFSQLIDNMRKILLEKSYPKCGGETSPKLLSKKSKLSISLNQYSKAFHRLVILYARLRAIEMYWN